MKKFFSNLFKSDNIFQSSKPVAFGSFLLVAIILTSLLSIRYSNSQGIIENGIAQKAIHAKNTFQIIDKQRTESIKREVANKIRPVIIPVEQSYIEDDLDKAYKKIKEIRAQKTTYSEKQKELFNLINIDDLNRKNQTIDYVLSTTDSNLTSVYNDTKQVINEIISNGILDTDISSFANEKTINKALGTQIKRTQYQVIVGLIEHSIVPNLIIDEYATDIARKNAKNAVKPYTITFKKGDTILRQGERVTQLKKDALKAAGYNAFELNRSGVFGIFSIVCLIMYSLILYIRQYEKKYYTPRYMLYIALSSIIFTFCCASISIPGSLSNYLMPFIAFTVLLAIFTNPVL